MIKFLISIFFVFFIFGCKEVQKKQINSKINDSIKKIEKIIDNKNNNNKNLASSSKQLKNNNNIFYYLEDPYFIEGVRYVPEENYNYSEIGLSTFYGKELHNVRTVNNDINKVTELLGRHKTLPIPSMVKITNLDNGYSINIKIIDRHNDNTALIQVSRKVAQLLGFYKDRVATVRVDILSDASKQWKNVTQSLNEPEFNDTITSAPTETVLISDIDNISDTDKNVKIIENEAVELLSEEVNTYQLFLRISKFNNYSDIKFIMENLSKEINYTSEKSGSFYDLTIGPVEKTEIKNLVSYFISKGYKETKIILN